ncbi:MAG: O-antigen ligase/tetratricopeptide (TPR) repeat protein [Myxococcota bacterium]|jgi:O-antigen ligase/tetratricopeptide (TPR) repeat protein
MSTASPPDYRSSWLIVGVSALFPLSTVAYGAVHDLQATALWGCAALLGGGLAWRGSEGPAAAWWCWLIGLAALLISLIGLLPVGPGGRALLQPGIAALLDGNLALVGAETHPLALLPRSAAAGLASAAAALLLGLGALQLGVRPLARAVAVTAIGMCALGVAQRMTGATSIYWVSGVPAFSRSLFFGSLVNPNHAGILLAASLPLCAWLARQQRADRILGGLGILAALVGLILAGSRGAVLAAGCAGLLLLGLTGGRRAALGLVVVGVAVGIAVLLVGPQQTAWWLSMQIIPEDHLQDLTGRRLVIWRESLDLIAAAPLFGTGTGSFEDAYQIVKRLPHFSSVTHAHNDSLQALVEQGLVGGLLWIAAVVLPVLLTLRRCLTETGAVRWRSAALLASAAAILVGSLFDFPLRIGAIAALTAMLVGAMLSGGAPMKPSRWRLIRLSAAGCTLLAGLLGLLALSSPDPEDLTEAAEAREDAEPEVASAAYQRIIAEAPLHHSALIRWGRLRQRAGDTEGAQAVFVATSASYPTLPWPWLALARLRGDLGDTEGALAAWRGMLTCNLPDNDDATAWITEALAEGDDPSQAALAAIPERADRLQLAAKLLTQARDDATTRATAEGLYHRAIALEERSRIAFAAALLQWDRPEEAIAQVADFPPSQCAPVRITAKALLAQGETTAAIRKLHQAIRACPGDDASLKRSLLRAQLALGAPEAIAEAEAILKTGPDRHPLRRQILAALAVRLSRHEVGTDALLPHLEYLLLAGVATLKEAEDYSSIAAGLPPQHLGDR